MSDKPTSNEQLWERGWEAHEAQQQQRLRRLSLAEKIAWLEQAQKLVSQLRPPPKADADRR